MDHLQYGEEIPVSLSAAGNLWSRQREIPRALGIASRSWQKPLAHLRGSSGTTLAGRRGVSTTHHGTQSKMVYWHRELPPIDAELIAEHTVEATSSRVPGTIEHRDELWDRCYEELMEDAERRLAQEITRLGGHFAHVRDETIDAKHDDAAGEAWLHGRFGYMLYRRASESG